VTAGVVGGLIWAAAGSAFAQEVTGVSVHMPLLVHGSAAVDTKPDGGDSVKSKETTLTTAPLDESYVTLSWGKVSVYIYPFADLHLTSLSYMVTDEVELGLDLGLNSSSVDKPKSSSAENLVGVFATYYAELGANSLEALLIVDQTQTKNETTTVDETSGAETKSETTSTVMLVKPSVTVLVPLNKTMKYFAGLAYSMETSEEKVGDAKTKVSTNTFSATLAGVRFTL
jgi:hypothetical protein